MYENGKMRPAETEEGERRMMEGVNLTKYIVSTFVNVTMYSWYNYNKERKKTYYLEQWHK
jgi:hypothetical protein